MINKCDCKDYKNNEGYEKVDSIIKKGKILKVGDKIKCECQYKITELRPVYDADKKHLKDHPNNTFICIMTKSDKCIFHGKK